MRLQRQSILFFPVLAFWVGVSFAQFPQYEAQPVENPLVTGTFMEYREGNPHHFHTGVDMKTTTSEPSRLVRNVEPGTVVYVTSSGNDRTVKISHSGGTVTVYMHLGEVYQYIAVGNQLLDSRIALGRYSTAEGHVHFEIRETQADDADYLNPLTHLPTIQDNSIDYDHSFKHPGCQVRKALEVISS